MIFDIAYQAGLVLIGFGAGGGFMHYCKRTRMPKHEHGWEPWEDAGTMASPAQQRKCMSCGFVERVETEHVHTFGPWRQIDINIVDRDYSVSGQTRYCTGCNFKETVKINS